MFERFIFLLAFAMTAVSLSRCESLYFDSPAYQINKFDAQIQVSNRWEKSLHNDVMSADKLFTAHNVDIEKKVLDAISKLVKEHIFRDCDKNCRIPLPQ